MDGDYTAFEVYLDAVIGYDDLLYQLPHINPHAFRHTMASMLYYNGMDSVSISKRLGHAQVSTTSDIYAHVIAEADKKNADILSAIFLNNA
ncbi:MAG: tyrosine-type recombinase/integrase [Oscillospiraceae bacterium]|nr:tyrosine-type recombinase/integrase [Oscillospiraceae bacterium]